MRKRIKYKRLLLLLLFLLLPIFYFLLTYLSESNTIKSKTLKIKNHTITVEIADTPQLRNQGLSGRKNLPQEEGMLFTFPQKGLYRFWMKEMRFPLDFIWIDKDTVVDVSENVPAPKSKAEKLTTFTARKTFDNVLEVNAGIAKSLNIVIGDVIH